MISILQTRMWMLAAAFCLDALVGDPHRLWHPVQGIGKFITVLEHFLRRILHIHAERESDRGRKYAAGALIAVLVPLVSVLIVLLLLWAAGRIHPAARFILGVILCCQCLAARSLADAGRAVYKPLQEGDLAEARKAVSMYVGRNTEALDEKGVARAAVETVAENTSDGVIAPMFWIFLFGPAGGFFYKAVNTMDSMIGYRNDAYCYLGSAAAHLDDIVNFIPARIAGLVMVAAAYILRMDGANAWRIFLRDRKKHLSPNAGQTESAAAGALDVRLGGDAYYFGRLVHKESMGDPLREIRNEDILRMNRLMYAAAVLALLIFELILYAALQEMK